MGKNSLIKQNIIQYLEYRGITKYKFYQQTGISRGVLDKKSGLTEDNIEKVIAKYSDINPVWLLTGQGEMILKQPEDINKGVTEPESVYYKDCIGCHEKQEQINRLQDTIEELLEESKKDRDLIRSLVTGKQELINKQTHSA